MQKPEPPKPGGSFVPLLLASLGALIIGTVLFFLTLGFFGVILGVVAILFAFGGLQYLLWGRWLQQSLRDEIEAEAALERKPPLER